MNTKDLPGVIKALFAANMVPYLEGHRGIGKSQIVAQVAMDLFGEALEHQDAVLWDIRLAQYEVGDFGGLPELVEAKDGSRRTTHRIADFMPPDTPDTVGILFLDEVNRASPDMEQLLFQLLEPAPDGLRHFRNYTLSPGVMIVMAGNQAYNVYKTKAMDPALTDRVFSIRVEPDFPSWKKWAQGPGDIADEVIKFLETHGNMFHVPPERDTKGIIGVTPNPRAWKKTSDILKGLSMGSTPQADQVLRQEVIGGKVGTEAAALLMTYIDREYGKPISGAEVLESMSKKATQKKFLKQSTDAMTATITDTIDVVNKAQTDEAIEEEKRNITPEQYKNLRELLKILGPEYLVTLIKGISVNENHQCLPVMNEYLGHDEELFEVITGILDKAQEGEDESGE
jgi:hypothetical protein